MTHLGHVSCNGSDPFVIKVFPVTFPVLRVSIQNRHSVTSPREIGICQHCQQCFPFGVPAADETPSSNHYRRRTSGDAGGMHFVRLQSVRSGRSRRSTSRFSQQDCRCRSCGPGAGKKWSKELAPRLIETLLNAGRCDEAYKHMMIVPGESFQLYCRVMAEIGRGDELPGKVKDFQNAFPVKRLMADEEVSFEHLYRIPLHHGKALRYVSQGNLNSAMEELQTLNEMKRFGGEFDSIAESVIIAIHRKAGAKHCLTTIEKYSGDQPEKLQRHQRCSHEAANKGPA